MGRAKEIIVKVIPSKIANEFVKKHHYSGKVVPNSTLHFGCFLDNKLHGVMQYGSPFMKTKVLSLVHNTGWNEMLELNRMAFDNYLPKYSESRCIAISIKLIKKNAPQIKWILSFADGTQCGDGTIYRASGFVLTSIKQNNSIIKLSNGNIVAAMTYTKGKNILKQGGRAGIPKNAEKLKGNMFRYIYLIDKNCKINTEILPFSEIDKQDAGMYKGKKISLSERNRAQQ
tara:strand:+ start:2207 stop:2893 length:687 start_codon:yes stop_codon:yes gene_type:complete